MVGWMPRYSEPGVILSSFEGPIAVLDPNFQRGEAFIFRQSITFGDHIIYAGSIGLLEEYHVDADMGSEGWIVKLCFDTGQHHYNPVTGFIQKPLDAMGEHVQRLPDVMRDMVPRVPQKGDMIQLQHDLPLLDHDFTTLKAGSAVFLAEVGDYSGPMDYIDIIMLHAGRRYSATIQAYAIGVHMRVVSSINDARDDGRK